MRISFNEHTNLIRHRNDTLDIVRSRRGRLFRTGNALALLDLEEKFTLHNRELTSHFKWIDIEEFEFALPFRQDGRGREIGRGRMHRTFRLDSFGFLQKT